jgi:hypothetical protein
MDLLLLNAIFVPVIDLNSNQDANNNQNNFAERIPQIATETPTGCELISSLSENS